MIAQSVIEQRKDSHVQPAPSKLSARTQYAVHVAQSCPERLRTDKLNEIKRESIDALDAVVESESDFEYINFCTPLIPSV